MTGDSRSHSGGETEIFLLSGEERGGKQWLDLWVEQHKTRKNKEEFQLLACWDLFSGSAWQKPIETSQEVKSSTKRRRRLAATAAKLEFPLGFRSYSRISTLWDLWTQKCLFLWYDLIWCSTPPSHNVTGKPFTLWGVRATETPLLFLKLRLLVG